MAAVRWCLSAVARWLVDGISYLAQRLSWWSDFSIVSFFSEYVPSQRILRWPAGLIQPSVSIVDDVYWSVVTVLESVALVSMLCCFFLFCGCTL